MKLALIIDDYLPYSTRVGAKMFHELAVELMKQGHQVLVITPQAKQRQALVKDNIDGVEIWRFKSGQIKDISKVKRAINEALLSFMAWRAIRREITEDSFDGIIYYSPSIFFGELLKNLKRRCNCPAYLVLRDSFPQWVVDAGMIREGSVIEKYFRFFEGYSYKQADAIGVMSENNLKLFKEVTKNRYPSHVLRNWADVSPAEIKFDTSSYREQLGLQIKTIFFYGGNIGHAQDMKNLMRLVKQMQIYPNAHFLFVGQGDEVELINNLAIEWSLDNFTYLPSVDQKAFTQILKEIDVGLFSLAANHTAYNFPGKLLGYMVEGKPILGSVNSGNDLAEIVNDNQAGYIFINGEDTQLLDAAIMLLQDKELRTLRGINAHQLLSDQFSVKSAAKIITHEIAIFYSQYNLSSVLV